MANWTQERDSNQEILDLSISNPVNQLKKQGCSLKFIGNLIGLSPDVSLHFDPSGIFMQRSLNLVKVNDGGSILI